MFRKIDNSPSRRENFPEGLSRPVSWIPADGGELVHSDRLEHIAEPDVVGCFGSVQQYLAKL